MEFLDLPSAHSYQGEFGNKLIHVLADLENLEIFDCKAV